MKTLHRFLLPVLSASALAGAALAQPAPRFVVVNGELLGPRQLWQLDQASCTHVPDGSYWLDHRSGLWGYAGQPRAQGHLADGCRAPQRRPSLSERGLLYRPGEIINGR